MWQRAFLKLLHRYLEHCREHNSRFSRRALARRLKVSPGTISDLLAGRRMVSSRKALKMMTEMKDFEPAAVGEIQDLLQHDRDDRVLLSDDDYDILSDWLHVAILCALEADEPPRTKKELAQFFGVSQERVRNCLSRLEEVGLIAKPVDDFLLTGKYFTTSNDIPRRAIVKAHKNDMIRAHQALNDLAPENRDFVSLTVTGDAKKLKFAKVMIRKFLDRLSFALRGPNSDEVFKISVQLYPLKDQK